MSETPKKPGVLFVCSTNGGKSQMAAALMRELAGEAIDVHSCGTRPGGELNAESMESLAELGIDMAGAHPKAITDEALEAADVVVVLGTNAKLEPRGSARFENWITDEPSARGSDGMERMRLLRDEIQGKVQALLGELQGK